MSVVKAANLSSDRLRNSVIICALTACSFLSSLLTVPALASDGLLESSAPAQSEKTRELAAAYIRSLPDSQKIIVWPSGLRSYSVISDNNSLSPEIDNYFNSGLYPFRRFDNAVFQSIVIVTGRNPDQLRTSVVSSSNIGFSQELRDYIVQNIGHTGRCEARIELADGKWINNAAGLVLSNDKNFVDGCTIAILDYMNGFPVKYNDFIYDNNLPPPDVRRAVMWAFWVCSVAITSSENAKERTRDGVAPFPTKKCALEKVSKIR